MGTNPTPDEAAARIVDITQRRSEHPPASDDAREAWEGYKEECAFLAPIIARAWLGRKPPLVWKRFDSLEYSKIAKGCYQYRLMSHWEAEIGHLSTLAFMFRDEKWTEMEIACTPDGTPAPVELREVKEAIETKGQTDERKS